MFINGNDKVGKAKVYNSKKEIEQENLILELRDQQKRDSIAVAALVNILIAEGLEYKHKARLERIFERQANNERIKGE